MPDIALYYPWIDPTNGSTLRTAILYWDEMRTITPVSVTQPYHQDVNRVASDLGFLRPQIVDSDNPHVHQASVEFIEDFERSAIQSSKRVSRERGQLPADAPYGLSGDKISWQFREDVLRHQPPDHEGFYQVAHGFGLAYMARLAATIASAENLTAFSDQPASHEVLVDRYADDGTPDQAGRAEGMLVRMAFETLTIPDTVTLGRLWSFRETHYDELLRFRRALRRLARSLSGINDSDELVREVREVVRDDITPATADVKAKLGEKGIDFGVNVFEGVVAGFAGYAASGSLKGALAGFGVKLGFSAVRRAMGVQGVQRDAYAYLLNARKQFSTV